MNDIIEVLSTEESMVPVISTGEYPRDVLNRQEFVDQILRLLGILSNTRGSCTFALNGKWGSGKTFVLTMLERQLREYQDGEKYLVFHYNCWEYDYYDEPLVAVVAAMLDNLNEEATLLSTETRKALHKGFAAVKATLEKIALSFVENKLGIDMSGLVSAIKEGCVAVEEVAEDDAEEHAYDQYYAFKNALREAKEGLCELAAEKTVVVVVDELDRCLPNYAIKVLERLHHLFYGMENIVVVLAVDKSQLANTIKQIFGEVTETDTYLKKFINFEFSLSVGTITGGFKEKYPDYVAMFDEKLLETNFSIDDYVSALFAGIEIRTQERLVERIKTVHKMLFPEEKKDYSFMCFELMWLVFTQYYDFGTELLISMQGDGFSLCPNLLPQFSKYLEEYWRWIHVHTTYSHFDDEPTYVFSGSLDIPQLLIWYLHRMHYAEDSQYHINNANTAMRAVNYERNLIELQEVEKLLHIIQ